MRLLCSLIPLFRHSFAPRWKSYNSSALFKIELFFLLPLQTKTHFNTRYIISSLFASQIMFACNNEHRGCSQWFMTKYGMPIHLRSFTYNQNSSGIQYDPSASSTLHTVSRDAVGTAYRLECDELEFGLNNERNSRGPDESYCLQNVHVNFSDRNKSITADVRLSKLLKLYLGRLG